ncbi:hypothetical protein Y1Q_0004439 [Alligator mississippiensis]|uniref:Uncharacterized protein n=1 Tax=Alligator mississippiensis TaxID=8496 RepID=A0A151NTB7_ALLMI|nr:hypothetical protein Y1Q_0004439 [Alligator mississippiensis]
MSASPAGPLDTSLGADPKPSWSCRGPAGEKPGASGKHSHDQKSKDSKMLPARPDTQAMRHPRKLSWAELTRDEATAH